MALSLDDFSFAVNLGQLLVRLQEAQQLQSGAMLDRYEVDTLIRAVRLLSKENDAPQVRPTAGLRGDQPGL